MKRISAAILCFISLNVSAYVSCHGSKVDDFKFKDEVHVSLRQDPDQIINIYFEEEAKLLGEETIEVDFGSRSLVRDPLKGYEEGMKSSNKALKFLRSELDENIFELQKLQTRSLFIIGTKKSDFEVIEVEVPQSSLALDYNSSRERVPYQTKAIVVDKFDKEVEYLVTCLRW